MNKWGFTFSTKYCEELGLEPSTVATKILQDFKFSSVRICAYWDRIEKEEGKYDYSEIDSFINKFSKLEITLAFGMKAPRWPEFHIPTWTKNLTAEEFNTVLLNFIDSISSRYSDSPDIKYFQIENEPLYKFGHSKRKLDKELLEREIEIVKKNTNKKIILTETGENRDWLEISKLADKIGINMYSITYNSTFKRYITLPFNSNFYKRKKKRISKEVFVAELQAEPWGPGVHVKNLNVEEWSKSINTTQLIKNTSKALNSGLEEIWFWGVEWWYSIREENHSFFEAAQKIVNDKDFLSRKVEIIKQDENRKLLTKVSVLLGIIIIFLICLLLYSFLRS